ncbi:MAG: CBS domain-containing protein [Acetivibrionales bacterium]
MKIYKLMKKNFMTIRPEETIEDALQKMSDMKINGAPVVDKDDKLVGMIVKADIYRFLITPGHIDQCPVEWVMSKDVITASINEEVLTVARRLRENNIIAMPVLDGDIVRGVISIEDILDFYINKRCQTRHMYT